MSNMIYRPLVTLTRAITPHKRVRGNTRRNSAVTLTALCDKNRHQIGRKIDQGKFQYYIGPLRAYINEMDLRVRRENSEPVPNEPTTPSKPRYVPVSTTYDPL